VKTVIIITAGFRETGHEGLLAEKKMVEVAGKHQMRILGPNCLGLIDTVVPVNASFAAGMPRRGKIAFMSQSGALCTSVLDFALAQDVGFSRFVSLGNKARALLEAYEIPIPASRLCKTTDEAVDFAEEAGYPVVIKIVSPDILHKTDIGGSIWTSKGCTNRWGLAHPGERCFGGLRDEAG